MRNTIRVSLQTQLLVLFTILAVIASAIAVAPAARAQTEPIPAGSAITANPPMPTECGELSIALVFDVSGSIRSTGLEESKKAGVAVVEALKDTNTKIGIYSFASSAPAQGFTNLHKVPASQQDELKAAINSLKMPFSGGETYTNWEEGLRQVKGNGYQIVYFVTDGKPTRHGNNVDNLEASVQQAVKAANEVKAEGTRIVPVAVGDEVKPGSVPATYLNYISGSDDWIPVSNYTGLTDALIEQATKNCRGEVTIEKSFVDRFGNPVDPAEAPSNQGYEFKITGSKPNDPNHSISALDKDAVATDEDGKATLAYIASASNTAGTLTIQEMGGPSDSVQLKDVQCTDETGNKVNVQRSGNSFTVPAKTGGELSCQVKNVEGNIAGLSSGSSGSSVGERCIPAVGGLLGVALLAIPLIMLQHVKVPGLEALQAQIGEQIRRANSDLQRSLGIHNEQASQFAAQVDNQLKGLGANANDLMGSLAGFVGLLAVGGVLAAFCIPGAGSSGESVELGEAFGSSGSSNNGKPSDAVEPSDVEEASEPPASE